MRVAVTRVGGPAIPQGLRPPPRLTIERLKDEPSTKASRSAGMHVLPISSALMISFALAYLVVTFLY
jgi:hypothetical protein